MSAALGVAHLYAGARRVSLCHAREFGVKRERKAADLEAQVRATCWVDFDAFRFYRMEMVDVYYVGGFGVMGWVSAAEYDREQPDPLADSVTDIIEHMNTDHADALILLAGVLAGIESLEAAMTSVDRLGFHLRLKTQDGTRGARIAFLREVRSPAEARNVLIEMVAQARRR